LKAEVDRLVEGFVRSYLRARPPDMERAVAQDRPAFHELEKAIAEGDLALRRADQLNRAKHYVERGVDAEVAERIVALADMTLVPDVAAVARASGQPVRYVTEAFVRISDAMPLDRLARRLRTITPDGRWERWQHRGLLDDLRDLRRRVAVTAINAYPDTLASEAVERYLAERPDEMARINQVLYQLDRDSTAGMSGVAVAVRSFREILESER
jgi:NAD-specific glutamate dehydrogenase